MKSKRFLMTLLGMTMCLCLCTPLSVKAENTKNIFEDAKWELAFEDSLEQGIVQSVCVTNDYIVTIENVNDSVDTPDIIKAYYKNDKDENGSPVERFSLAKRIQTMHYEHGNGMAFNPNTNEIAVSLYTSADPENRGCIYILDAGTLEFKRKVKISDSYNILGIDYDEDNDRYAIQTNNEGGFSFKLLDSDFNIVQDLGEYTDTLVGPDSQDLCLSGDLIINFPLTLGMGIGEYINVYSVSGQNMIGSYKLDFGLENITWNEPESICELEPGVFLAAVNVCEADGTNKIRFYQTPTSEAIAEKERKAEEERAAEQKEAEKDNKTVKSDNRTDEYETQEVNENKEITVNRASVPLGQSTSLKNIIALVVIAVFVMGLTSLAILYMRVLGARRRRKQQMTIKRRRQIEESCIVAED